MAWQKSELVQIRLSQQRMEMCITYLNLCIVEKKYSFLSSSHNKDVKEIL